MASDYLKGMTNEKARKAGERYGINHSDYGFGRPGGVGVQKKDPKDYGKDVAAAAMNDYDTRRTIEAAAMSGKNKAEKYAKNGFKDLTDVTKANNMFAKMHERHGNGGDFSSNSDYAGLTYNMVQRDRNKLMDSMTANEQQDQAERGVAEPTTPSEELQGARDTVDELENKDYDIFNSQVFHNGDNEDQRNKASQAFLGKFKLDLKNKTGMKPVLPS